MGVLIKIDELWQNDQRAFFQATSCAKLTRFHILFVEKQFCKNIRKLNIRILQIIMRKWLL